MWQPLHFPHEKDDFVIPTLSVLLLFVQPHVESHNISYVNSENAYDAGSLLAIWHDL